MVEPDRNGHPNLRQQVKKYLQKSFDGDGEVYAQHIHRLDRPVSGIVLFTKDRTVLKNLNEQFAERKVKKFYRAITPAPTIPQSGILEHWHRKEKKRAVLYDTPIEYAEKAILHYEISSLDTNHALWNIELHTGKFHQIRAQLANAGCPIVGDVLYGSTEQYLPDAIALEAYKLIFNHPVAQHEMVMEINSTLG